MNRQTIIDYQAWADRGYVTALTCKNHEFHKLIPTIGPDGIILVCPRGDYKRNLGKQEFQNLEKKNSMAEWLFRNV